MTEYKSFRIIDGKPKLVIVNENGKNMERIYIFPWKEIMIRKSIKIYKDTYMVNWHEKYRVADNICNNVDKIFEKSK